MCHPLKLINFHKNNHFNKNLIKNKCQNKELFNFYRKSSSLAKIRKAFDSHLYTYCDVHELGVFVYNFLFFFLPPNSVVRTDPLANSLLNYLTICATDNTELKNLL